MPRVRQFTRKDDLTKKTEVFKSVEEDGLVPVKTDNKTWIMVKNGSAMHKELLDTSTARKI